MTNLQVLWEMEECKQWMKVVARRGNSDGGAQKRNIGKCLPFRQNHQCASSHLSVHPLLWSLADQESARWWSEVKESNVPLNICPGTFCTWREGTIRRNPLGEGRKHWRGFIGSIASLTYLHGTYIATEPVPLYLHNVKHVSRAALKKKEGKYSEKRNCGFCVPKKLETILLNNKLSIFKGFIPTVCFCVSSAVLKPERWFYTIQIFRFGFFL